MIGLLKDILTSWLVGRLEKEIQKLERKLEQKRKKFVEKIQDEHEMF